MKHAQFRKLHPFRARGLQELSLRVGDITADIDRLLKEKRKVRILEIGFGFGTALVELSKKYGDRVELHGINKTPKHGDRAVVQKNALSTKLLTRKQLATLEMPMLHFKDVSEGLPFPNDHFDLVYSQVAFPYFDDKLRVIEEINRVLTKEGVARIDLLMSPKNSPPRYRENIELWDKGVRIPFWAFAKRWKSIKKKRASKRPYLHMTKARNLRFGAELVYSINFQRIHDSWWGRKSIYKIGEKK